LFDAVMVSHFAASLVLLRLESAEYTCERAKTPHLRGHPLHFAEEVQLGQVAIYCRVSTDDQSCARQERDLRAFARRAGHHVVGVFKETASGAKNDRAERNKVMALAQAHEIDAILVTELSRWGRSTQDLVQTLDDLHSWKVSVLAQTGLSFDLSTASGKLMRTIMAGLAEFERYVESMVMRSARQEVAVHRNFLDDLTRHNSACLELC